MKSARSAQEVERVKSEILSAALQLLVAGGFQAFTMRGLARRLSMSAPNLYNYYAKKEEIYLTLMLRGFEGLAGALSDAAAGESEALLIARAVARRYIAFGLEQPSQYALMFSSDMPKYREFRGTTTEKLSAKEHEISLAIAEFGRTLIVDVAREMEVILSREQAGVVLTGVWSLLHGAVSLTNSQNLDYVVEDVPTALEALLDGRVGAEILRGIAGTSS